LLVAGVSARLVLTDAYRVFFERVAGSVWSALGNAHAIENERRKAEALAELSIDRDTAVPRPARLRRDID
jgi:hypothetical protein